MSLRVGLYGGCFNPVHDGHLAAARGACDVLGLDRLIFIPSGNPPLKGNAGLAESIHRLAMLDIATADEPRWSVSDAEITRAGPSFTVDTVRAMKGALPVDAELFFLLGDDCIDRLPKWKGIDELHTMLRFVVLPRWGQEIPHADKRLMWLPLPQMDVSSTQIRGMCQAGHSLPAPMLCAEVAAYIKSHGLYTVKDERAHV